MNIRLANLKDYAALRDIKADFGLYREKLAIDPEYRHMVQSLGFLFYPDLAEDDFQRNLQNFLVCDEEAEIQGFLRLGFEQGMPETPYTQWLQPLKEDFFSQPHAVINGVAAKRNASNRGIGRALVDAAIRLLRKRNISVKYLYSFVVLSPVTNHPSMLFHERLGFERVALNSYPAEIEKFGLRPYASLLYAKSIGPYS